MAQETLLAALATPPPDAASDERLKAWMGRVAFNLSHLDLRKTARRRAREEQVARAEREDSTLEGVARASVSRRVTSAVSALPEPYRTAVHLRYFEDLSTAEIAARTATTETAVRKRLWRARERLRRQLEPTSGGRSLVGFLLAPFLPRNRRGPWLKLGAGQGLVALSGGAALLALIPALGGLGNRAPELAGTGRDLALATSLNGLALNGSAQGDSTGDLPLSMRQGRTPLTDRTREGVPPVHEPSDPPTPPESVGRFERTGQVLGFSSGDPLGGLPVRRADGTRLTHSGSDGSFRFEGGPGALVVEAGGSDYLPLNRVRFEARDAHPAALLVERGFPLVGFVHGAHGPTAGAELRLALDLGEPSDGRSETLAYRTHTGPDGRYAFRSLPQGEGLSLEARAPGHAPTRHSLATPLPALRPVRPGTKTPFRRLSSLDAELLASAVSLRLVDRCRRGPRVPLPGRHQGLSPQAHDRRGVLGLGERNETSACAAQDHHQRPWS